MTIRTVLIADPVYDENGYCDETGVDPIVIFRYDASDEQKFQGFMADYAVWMQNKLREYYREHGQNVYKHEENIKEFYANVTQQELFKLELIKIDGMEYV